MAASKNAWTAKMQTKPFFFIVLCWTLFVLTPKKMTQCKARYHWEKNETHLNVSRSVVTQKIEFFPLISRINTFPLISLVNTSPLINLVNTFPLISLINTLPLISLINTFPLINLINTFPLISLINTFPLISLINADYTLIKIPLSTLTTFFLCNFL